MNLSKTQFLLLSQVIIFILGWPLEWTEIIVIFMPIFIPLLDNFGVDPLFFGLLVALNLQTAFLSPAGGDGGVLPEGRGPPHVTLNQIFARHDAVHGHPGASRSSCCTCSRRSGCGCRSCSTSKGRHRCAPSGPLRPPSGRCASHH